MKFVDALAGAVGNRVPVPYTGRQAVANVLSGYGGAKATLLGAYGTNGTLYATVSRYANATSQVCWGLYRKQRNPDVDPTNRKRLTSHLALDVWAMPNPYTPQQQFIEAGQQHLELVGECWWVVNRNLLGWPESMWLVRPDRMSPVPSTELGLAGYLYHGPNGEQIPLGEDDVIWLKMPNPSDPGPAGRGMGAAQTILAAVEGMALSQQWNRNFFANSAVPGGVITVPEELGDTSFNRLRMQWAEQHQGTRNASRVAVLEGGATWSAGSTQKDMEFTELLNVGRDVVREAYAMPKSMLGVVEDVNRANAEASDAMFATWNMVPRLERIKQALNTRLLPMFGPVGYGTTQPDVEFDYDNPVPPDQASENITLTARVNSYAVLIKAGVDPQDAAQVCDLPDMRVTRPPIQAGPAITGDPATDPAQDDTVPAIEEGTNA